MGAITSIAEHERQKMASDELGEFLRSEMCTDLHAARIFVRHHGPGVRWNPEWGWLCYDGIRWKRDSAKEVLILAQTVADYFREEAIKAHVRRADDKLVKALLSFSRRCESARGMEDFLKLAAPMLHQPTEDFDRRPWFVNLQNVTLDLRTSKATSPRQMAHADGDYLTKVIPYDWDYKKPRHRWDKFLEEIFPGEELRGFIKRAVGYSLLGLTSEQCFFICHGGGCNGKSVFLNVLLRVLGADYAQQADPQSFMAQRGDSIRTDLADLRGVRFVSAIENERQQAAR